MTGKVFLYVLISVGLSASAQIVLKIGVSSPSAAGAVVGGSFWSAMLPFFTSIPVWIGLTMYAAGAVSWLFVLAQADVSVAYPFIGLGFILTMVMGAWILAEPVGLTRIIGTLMVVLGVYLVGRS